MTSEQPILLLETMRATLGKDTATRPEILEFVRTQLGSNKFPEMFNSRKIQRGLYSLDENFTGSEVDIKVSPLKRATPQTPKQPVVAMAPVVDMTQAREVKLNAGENFDRAGLTPSLDQNFVPYGCYKKLDRLLSAKQFLPVYVTGPTGVGKSSMVKHICAKKGRMFARVTITAETTDDDLFGRKTLKDGNVIFEDGVLTMAAELGFPIVLDEISAGDPRKLFGLYTILEGDRHFIKDANKFVTPRPGFTIICTDNTYGRGDDAGRYIGTNILNEAMLDRFALTIEQSYPTEAEQVEILTNRFVHNGIQPSEKIVRFINNIAKWATINRNAFAEGAVEDVISVRRTLAVADIYSIFRNEEEAIADACTRFGPETREAMVRLYNVAATPEETEAPEVQSAEEFVSQL